MFFYIFLLTLIICNLSCRYQRGKIETVLQKGDLKLQTDAKNSKCQIFTMWRVFPDCITFGGTFVRSSIRQEGRTCLTKFIFSTKFPIGLHVILQLQIKKFKFASHRIMKIILSEKPLELNI